MKKLALAVMSLTLSASAFAKEPLVVVKSECIEFKNHGENAGKIYDLFNTTRGRDGHRSLVMGASFRQGETYTMQVADDSAQHNVVFNLLAHNHETFAAMVEKQCGKVEKCTPVVPVPATPPPVCQQDQSQQSQQGQEVMIPAAASEAVPHAVKVKLVITDHPHLKHHKAFATLLPGGPRVDFDVHYRGGFNNRDYVACTAWAEVAPATP